jgi:enamine deaminase RidA (YjgF/YER057c/UK114 family)
MAKPNQVNYHFEPVERQFGFCAIAQAGTTLYLSGLISVNEKLELVAPGDMAGQIRQIYVTMEKILALHGATFAHVMNELIFTTDLAAFAQHHHPRLERYANCEPPATTAVQVAGLFIPGALIEIQATAVLD